MCEHSQVTYPIERIIPYTARSLKERGLVENGTKLLLVDITPDSLRHYEVMQINPLTCSVVEILPRKNGIPHEPDHRERLIKQKTSSGGIFINIETHDEVTPSAVGSELRDEIAQMRDRLTLTVIASGLSKAVNRLKQFIIDTKIPIDFDISEIDINRCFISPHNRADNLFEELAQNYLRFIISKYSLHHLSYFDIHGESDDYDILPHVILGRTAKAYDKNALYEQTIKNFPFLTVLWDIKEPFYSNQRYNQSLADALLAFGETDSVTIECAAAKGGVHQTNKNLTKMAIIKAMIENRLITEELALGLLKKYRDLISGTMPVCANSTFGYRPLCRHIVEIEIQTNGVMQILFDLVNAILLRSNSQLALINSSGFDKQTKLTDSFVRIPQDIDECVVLGLPDAGILEAGQRILLTLAVPEN